MYLLNPPLRVGCCNVNPPRCSKQAGAPPPRVSLVGLGCPKNVVDGEVMLGDLQRHGFAVTDDHEDADVRQGGPTMGARGERGFGTWKAG